LCENENVLTASWLAISYIGLAFNSAGIWFRWAAPIWFPW